MLLSCALNASALSSGRNMLQARCGFGSIDVTAAPYRADPTGTRDSAAAINAAVAVSGMFAGNTRLRAIH